jgi:hypothetical protein
LSTGLVRPVRCSGRNLRGCRKAGRRHVADVCMVDANSQGELRQGKPVKVVKEKTTKRPTGDPRFLAQIGWCIETRLEVMGILRDIKTVNQIVTQQIDWPAMLTSGPTDENDVDRMLAELERIPNVGEQLPCGLKELPANEPALPVNRLECKPSRNGNGHD